MFFFRFLDQRNKTNLFENIIFFVFCFSFLFSGVGVFFVDPILFFIIFFFIHCYYFIFFKKKINDLKIISFFLFLFLFFLSISFFYSVDKINSFSDILLFSLGFTYFIFGLNENVTILRNARFFFVFVGLTFIFFSILNIFVKFDFFDSSLQLIYPYHQNHNHLGSFLGLALIYFLILSNKQRLSFIEMIVFLIFLVFFILSFSKSAYFSFIITFGLFIFLKKSFHQIKIFLVLLNFILVSFLFVSSREIVNFLNTKLDFSVFGKKLEHRPIISGRVEYFRQAILGFRDKPMFGWGPNNFIYISRKYASTEKDLIESAFSLPLNILAENGIFVFLTFFFFIFWVFKNTPKKNDNLFLFLALYLLFNFFINYTYSILPFFFLFFIFLGVAFSYSKTGNEEKKYFFSFKALNYSLLFFITFFFLCFYSLPYLLDYFKVYKNFFLPFVFNHDYYHKIITNHLKNGDVVRLKEAVREYSKKSHYSLEKNYLIIYLWRRGAIDVNLTNQLTADFLNNQRLVFFPFDFVKKIYYFKKLTQGDKEAGDFFSRYYLDFLLIEKSFPPTQKNLILTFCSKEKLDFCQYKYFSFPNRNQFQRFTYENQDFIYFYNDFGLKRIDNHHPEKKHNVFRIAVGGDATAFGIFVDEKENWTEVLEKKLNLNSKRYKFEVINFSYYKYDFVYALERLIQQALSFDPDLIIVVNTDFLFVNEFFNSLMERESLSIKNNLKERQKYIITRVSEKYAGFIENEEVFKIQKKVLERLFSSYQKGIIIVSFSKIPSSLKLFLQQKPNVKLLELVNFSDNKKKNLFLSEKSFLLNSIGHRELANQIHKFIYRDLFQF